MHAWLRVEESLQCDSFLLAAKDATIILSCVCTHVKRHSAMQVDTDFSNDADVRTMLLVHDTRPPFLDGRVIFTKQAEAVMPLKDPTSDLAVIAKTGSKLVKEIRDKKNEGKSRQRFWEVAGSKMGKITGTFHAAEYYSSSISTSLS